MLATMLATLVFMVNIASGMDPGHVRPLKVNDENKYVFANVAAILPQYNRLTEICSLGL